jgi:hypothetical protein
VTKSEAASLQIGDIVIVIRSGKIYRVDHPAYSDGSIQSTQLRDGKPYGPIRYLKPAAVQRLSTADDRHPASRALTAALQPPAQDAWKAIPAPQPARRERTPRNDGDEGDRLARKVVRYAERWQRKFPCPEAASDPELAAIWRAVEQLLAHDSGRTPEPRAVTLQRVQSAIPLPPMALTDHGDRITTTADALTDRQADDATAALQRRGFHVERLRDPDGRWGLTVWI